MKDALLVPLNLDVLRLSASTAVAGPWLDLEMLPWSSKTWGRDVNADTPFLASGIAIPPFGGTQRVLEAGFHLHWALPDALCLGVIDPNTGKVSFPAVPNRWLITRILDGETTRWVVESDFIWPTLEEWSSEEDLPPYHQSLAVTLFAHDLNSREQPFQHIGRAFSWAQWRKKVPKRRIASGRLTAVGYGDAMFAAYHPLCHSVFGFSDSWTGASEVPEQVEYRVVGWFADTEQDPLAASDISWTSDGAATPTWKLADYKWKVRASQPPTRTLCFASAHVSAGSSESTDPCTAIIANTGSEAMSVYLAAQLSSEPSTQAKIEDQLEAMQSRVSLRSGAVDLVPQLHAARHERGFRPERGVPLWKVTVVDGDVEVTAEMSTALTEAIRTLNALEKDFHERTVEHRAAKRALFADWCEYMATAYHPPDEQPQLEVDAIKDYIERIHLRVDRGPNQSIIEEKAEDLKNILKERDACVNAVNERLQAFRQDLVHKGQLAADAPAPLQLEQVPGPQFWAPTDPVVLMTGRGLRVTERHGQDGRGQPDGHLACGIQTISGDPWADKKPDFTAIADALAVPAELDASLCTGFSVSNGRPYHPIVLEWNVDAYPTESHSPQRFSGHGGYDPKVIVDNYDVPPRGSDLVPRVGVNMVADPDRYDGRCFLSSHASDVVFAQLCKQLEEQLLEGYGPLQDAQNSTAYQALLVAWHDRATGSAYYPPDPARPGRCRFEPNERAALKAWYLDRPLGPDGATTLASQEPGQRFDDPLWTTICALDALYGAQGERRAFLSASIDGFNNELLGFTNLPVLPLDEPIGFDPYRQFSQAVGKLTGQGVPTPERNNPYSPIRSGELEVSALRVIDSFGQIVDLEPARVLGPIRYMAVSRQGALSLPPRVVQPMHAKFRWLDAEHATAELVEAPGSEVICGWMVPNPATSSLTVFSRAGVGLGLLAVDRDEDLVEWVPAPGQPAFAVTSGVSSRERDILQMEAALDNLHLRRVVRHLWDAPAAYFLAFVDTLVDAQENIDPVGSSQYSSMAMLMGRPLAVARAELDILALDKTLMRGDRVDLERRIRGGQPSDDGFQRVQFPMRLGDYRQLNDGLAGYWIEHPDGSYADRCFHAQSADDVAGLGAGQFAEGYKIEAFVKTPKEDGPLARFEGQSINIRQTIADAPLALTILFDPCGVVHLTTGILPTKVIDVPPTYFAEALRNIEVWLKVGPLLSRQGNHDLPLPSDPAYDLVWRESAWSKTETGADQALLWDDLRQSPTIRADFVVAGLKTLGLSTSIGVLVAQRWLSRADPNGLRYRLLPKEKRGALGLSSSSEEALGTYLEQRAEQLGEILTGARFDASFSAREGWLVFQQQVRPSSTGASG